MATLDLIKKALLELKPRTGASVPAITKWIEANGNVRLLELVNHRFLFLRFFDLRKPHQKFRKPGSGDINIS
jgi:hypothetical protein